MRKFYLRLGWLAFSGALLSHVWAAEIRGKIVISQLLTKPRVSIPNYRMRGPSTPHPRSDASAGTYRVIVWHRAAGFFRRNVKLSDHRTVDPAFEIPVQEAP